MEKVFMTHDGKMYKAEERKDNSHSEINFPTGDMLRALNEIPCTREEMISRINHVDFHNEQAVLAPITEDPIDN
jgi:hypothetical protein